MKCKKDNLIIDMHNFTLQSLIQMDLHLKMKILNHYAIYNKTNAIHPNIINTMFLFLPYFAKTHKNQSFQ